MTRASISKAWDETRTILRREGRMLSAVALALLVLPYTILGTLFPAAVTGTEQPTPSTILPMLALLIIGIIARITLARIAMGPAITLGAAMQLAAVRSVSALLAFALFLIPVAALVTPLALAISNRPDDPPAAAAVGFLVVVVVAFVIGVRLLLLVIPASAAERLGPVALLKQSWTSSRGNWWRLIGFLLIFLIGSTIASWVVQSVVGGMLLLAGGEIEPLSIGALILSAAVALTGALFAVIFAVMIARIYLQLAGDRGRHDPEVSVPSSGI